MTLRIDSKRTFQELLQLLTYNIIKILRRSLIILFYFNLNFNTLILTRSDSYCKIYHDSS